MTLPNGRVDAPVVIVGDAPSDKDVETGIAFSGEVYTDMCELLKLSDINPEDCVFVNAVGFQKYEKKGILTKGDIRPDADANLIPFIQSHPRKLVLALGNNAVCAVGVRDKPEKATTLGSQKLSSSLLPGIDVAVSQHPWSVLKEPDNDLAVLCDFRYAQRILSGIKVDQVPIEIRDIETPEDFDMIWDAIAKNPEMAYDYEATDLDRDLAVPVSLSLCNGLKNQSGEFIVWFWAGYDRLQPRFDRETMNRFRDRFVEFFEAAGDKYDLLAWHAAYDDWLTESLAAKEFPLESFASWKAFGRVRRQLPGSQYDGMLMKWSVNNRRPHGLKETTALYLGYPNYDATVDERIKEVKARRGKLLKHPDDFFTLKWYGIEPVKTKTGYRWPENVSKGLAMYAMLPMDDLRLYNCYDAVYTWLNIKKLGRIIDNQNLGYSCDFRHRVARELMLCEQRGMQCDVELNRKFSKELAQVEERCNIQILEELKKMGVNKPDFNVNSGDQLIEILYGEPTALPFIDRAPLYKEFGRQRANDMCNMIEDMVYEDVVEVPLVREAISAGHEIDVEVLKDRLSKEFWKRFKREIVTYDELYYLKGLYRPFAFTKSGKPSTAGVVLQTLYQESANPFLALVLMSRRANKLKGTFVDGIYVKLDENHVLRSRFNPIGTETGRISSSDPNGQNFQKHIRGQLVPRKGYKFLEWDLSQAEIRGIAAESGDPGLIAAVSDPESDIHTNIASMVFKIPKSEVRKDTHRRYAKTIVFGLIYGMSAFRLAMAINVTVQEAERFMAEFFAAFPVMQEWLKSQVRKAHQRPYYVYTPWGTRRSTKNTKSLDKGVVRHTERIATNMPIQGGAGELCLWYICEIMDRIRDGGWDAHLVNTTHDSCTLEVREDLVWLDDNGTISGPVADIVRKAIATPPPVYPLDRVSWVADLELNDWWSHKPNLQKALDPNMGEETSIFRWDLIKPKEVLSNEEVEELIELEEANVGVSTV